jgi:flagellar hook-associated protein 2
MKALISDGKEHAKFMSTTSLLSSVLGSTNSTNDINLSAILEAATGASSAGIDVNSAVSAAVTAAEAPEDTWESQIATLATQTSDLTAFQTAATNLDNDMEALSSLTGALASTTVTSSDSGALTATTTTGATVGNTVVEISNLATTASYASTAVASATTALPAGTITITNGSGTATNITTGSGVNTLTDLENAINSAGLGVTASIITDASGSQLALVSNTSGSAGNFTVSSTGTGFGFTAGATGANASLTVNGIPITSATNTVSGVIPGVTLNLLSASSTTNPTQITLSVAPNTTAVSTAINQFVSDYNTIIGYVNSEYTDTPGTGQGALAEDPTVSTLQSDLLQSMDFTASPASGETSTTMPNLSSMGITVGNDGTLTVDSTTLDSALQNNYSDVVNFFQGSAQNGFANSLNTQLTSFISPSDGAFTVDLQSISNETTALNTDITNFQTNVIAPLQTQLQTEYSNAEIALQQLPSEIKNVDAELGLNNSSSS